jgi:hypothetical protein
MTGRISCESQDLEILKIPKNMKKKNIINENMARKSISGESYAKSPNMKATANGRNFLKLFIKYIISRIVN